MASIAARQSLVFGKTAGLTNAKTTRPVARNVALKVSARDAAWCPGTEAPAYLDGTLPGDYGFDPLGLGEKPELLQKFREAELLHCRWTMLASVGMLAVEGGGFADSWIDGPQWALDGSHATYFNVDLGPTQLLYTGIAQLVLMGGAEYYRNQEEDAEKRMYPGGAFDPFGFAKGDFEGLKNKEIKNGRLAMISVLGYFMQGAVCHEGPIESWKHHLADPFGYNVATSNNIAVPYLHPGADFSEFWSDAVPAWYPGI